MVSLIAFPMLLIGQQANVNLDYNPQKNTEGLIPFSAPLNSPEVHDDQTVTFRIKAPEAKEVKITDGTILTALGRGREPLSLVKGEDGIWSVTVGPFKPDMYAYHFNVDGVQMADPSNTMAAFTAMPPYSELDCSWRWTGILRCQKCTSWKCNPAHLSFRCYQWRTRNVCVHTSGL